MTSVWRNRSLGSFNLRFFPLSLFLWCVLAGLPLAAEASQTSGRIRLNYHESTIRGDVSSQLFQEYRVSSQDRIFGSNMLRLDLRWDRIVDYAYPQAVDRPVLRATLTGLAYDFTLRYTPSQYATPAGRVTGSKLEGLQAAWRFQHDGLPGLRLEYRDDKRHQAQFNFNTFSSVARMRLAELDHRVGMLRFGASYRQNDNTSTAATAGDRTAGTTTLRVVVDKAVTPALRVSLGGDVQRTEVSQDPSPDTVSRTRNLRGSAVMRLTPRLRIGVTGFFREMLNEGGGRPSLLDVNRTFSTRAVFIPTEELDLSLQREIRDLNRPAGYSYYDVLRMQAIYSGRLRRGLRARLTGMKYVTIKTQNAGTPADATDLTLHFQLYRRTTARASLTYNRQQHRDSEFLSRHAVNKVAEVKSQLTRRLLVRLDYRGSQTSRAFEFLEIDSHNYSANLNYTNSGGFSLSGSVRKSILKEEENRSQTFFGLNMAGRLTAKFTFNLDGTWTQHTVSELGERASGYNARLYYRFSNRTFLTANYQTSERDGERESDSFGASFQTAF